MTRKISPTRSDTARQSSSPPTRAESHIRFKAPARRSEARESATPRAPSTLPPPPFLSEAEVAGSEWWLESHMNLAGKLLCLEQVMDAVPAQSAARVRGVLEDLSEVRDALYEVYCDAADPRMRAWTAEDAPFATYIIGLYAWCDGVADAHIVLARKPELAASGEAGETATAAPLFDDGAAQKITDALHSLDIDQTSPVEPLRNVFKDIEEMFFVARSLHMRLKTNG